MQSVTHQWRYINKLVLAVIIHGQSWGWCWRLWGRNKRQVIDVLCQMLCEGDTLRQSCSYCYLIKRVYVCESKDKRLLKQVCVSTCWWCVIIHYLQACCWLSAESKSQSHLDWASYRNITLIATAVAQPVRPMRDMRILYLIFDLNQTIWLHVLCAYTVYLYCPKSFVYFYVT